MSTIFSIKKTTAAMLVSLTLVTGAHPAIAEDGNPIETAVGTKKIMLELPAGMCEMDPANPNDKRMIEASKASIRGNNELLMQFVDCKELKDWRSGTRRFLDNFGSYQVSLKLKDVDLTGQETAIVGQVCGVFKKQGAELLDTVKPAVNERLKSSFGNIRINEAKMLGIVKEEDNLCAIATLQRVKTEDDTVKDQLTVYSVSLVGGRMIYSYLFTQQGPDQLAGLTRRITALHQANQAHNKK